MDFEGTVAERAQQYRQIRSQPYSVVKTFDGMWRVLYFEDVVGGVAIYSEHWCFSSKDRAVDTAAHLNREADEKKTHPQTV